MADRVDGLGVVVTREPSTDRLYGKRVATLTRRATEELGHPAALFDTIECFCLAHEEFKAATIRHYAAALALAIDLAEERGGIDESQAAACRQRLADRPTPRRPEAERRTSAKKRKSLKPSELRAVCEKLRRRARGEDTLLLKLLANNVTFGLRPREYEGALVGEIYLVVQNAKATNGRALSATRELALEGLSKGQLKSLRCLIDDMEAAAAGDVVALIDRLGARLRRVCKSLKIVPFSLYTTRHQAIANKKATSSDVEVAAFAGHAAVHTARKHYAPRGAAWKIDKTASPSPEMVELVKERQASIRRPGLKL